MKSGIAKLKYLALLLPLSSFSWALDAMDDESLAAQTGQDGISISLQFPNSTISFDQAVLIDKGGIAASTTHNTTASLVFAPTYFDLFQGIRLLKTDSGAETAADNPIRIHMDADANGTQPVFNMNIALPSDMKRIKITPFSVFTATGDASSVSTDLFNTTRTSGLTAGSGTATAYSNIRSGVREILRMGGGVTGGGLDIVFADYHAANNPNNTVGVNVQLGIATQGAMMRFTGGSIKSISNPAGAKIQLLSYNGTNPLDSPAVVLDSINFDLNIQATNQSTGFRLYDHDGAGGFGGFYLNVVNDGVIFGANGTTDKIDAAINNVIAGNAGAATTTSDPAQQIFNNLPNGVMGSFGVTGASITNLKVNVKGL